MERNTWCPIFRNYLHPETICELAHRSCMLCGCLTLGRPTLGRPTLGRPARVNPMVFLEFQQIL